MHYDKKPLPDPLFRAFMLATLASCASTPEQESSPVEVKPAPQPSAPVKMSIQQLSEPTPEEALEIHTVDIPYKAPAQTDEALMLRPGRLRTKLCEEIGSKLGSVSIDDCLQQQLISFGPQPRGQVTGISRLPTARGQITTRASTCYWRYSW